MTIEKVYGCSKLQKFVKFVKFVNSFVVVFVVRKPLNNLVHVYLYFIKI